MRKKAYNLDNDSVADYFKNYKPGYGLKFFGKGELLPMRSVKLEWEDTGAKQYEVWLDEDVSFSHHTIYVVSTNSIELDTLIPGLNYFWKVRTVGENENGDFSKIRQFTTKARLRSIAIDGVSNVRDLGGSKTKEGRTVKYGVLYRSAKGDEITEKGKKAVRSLGIRTDLDLRGGDLTKSPFGDDVKLIRINGAYYNGHNCGVDGEEAYRNAFRDELKACADPKNYPMLFHCAIGRDRTGTLALVLLAICGVSKEDLIKEYELSYLSIAGALDGCKTTVETATRFCDFIEASHNGETFAEKASCLAKSLGVTKAEIASIKHILLV